MEMLVIDKHSTIISRYLKIREQSLNLVAPLSEADAQLQSMPDASPAKWHLAHTTWFFETFILCSFLKGYKRFNETYNYLYNSYYNGIGEQYPRAQRGLISRPSLGEIVSYREFVDAAIQSLFEQMDDLNDSSIKDLSGLLELGLNHEQQHQELLLTDIKHAFFHNPLYPSYSASSFTPSSNTTPELSWLPIQSGLVPVGYDGDAFVFDNERPEHSVYIHDFSIASRLVTNGEYAEFIASGGYQNPDFWLADGWAWLQQRLSQNHNAHPLYWVKQKEQWFEFTLAGLLPLNDYQAVTHINYYEANAYANWLGVRLPTEFEWEAATRQMGARPFVSDDMSNIALHTSIASRSDSSSPFLQAFGNVWQWTTSGYGAYPGFSPFSGVAGEYNGKFMSNQNVLRGGSCVTPIGHTRETYRNFFYAHQQWQFTGIRLAK